MPALWVLCIELLFTLSQRSCSAQTWRTPSFPPCVFLVGATPHLLSSFALLEHLAIIILGAGLFCHVHCRGICYARLPIQKIHDEVLKIGLESECIPAISCFRVMNGAFTAIAVLAVDFLSFPGRLAKTKLSGTGVIDLGVGGFFRGRTCMEGSRFCYLTESWHSSQ